MPRLAKTGPGEHIGPVRIVRVGGTAFPKGHVVSVDALLNISDSARQAFGAFDWSEHAGKGVRLFVQGFG